jgi:ATP-dependent RNA helicase DeaD
VGGTGAVAGADIKVDTLFLVVSFVLAIGEAGMGAVIHPVQAKPDIIVGTPGSVMDMHRRGNLPYENVRLAVLDEVDRMLDIGFRDDIRRILGTMKHKHQTIFVSATISQEIERLARRFMKSDAVRITTVAGSLTVSLVDQKYFAVEPWDKRALLLQLNTSVPRSRL